MGKVKMIYIDPPYNTGNDFVYHDDFHRTQKDEDEAAGVFNEAGERMVKNTETNGKFHSDWCSMIYSRLMIARSLLKEDGVIFMSIDDNEVENLKKISDEVFGESNYIASFPWRKRTAKSDVPFGVSQDYEQIICYAKTDLFVASVEGKERKYYSTPDFPNERWRIHDMSTQRTATERPNSNFTMVDPKNGREYPVNPQAVWRITERDFQQYLDNNRIVFPGDYDFLKISKPVLRYWERDDKLKAGDNFGRVPVSTKLPDDIGMSQDGTKDFSELFGNKSFSYPKPVKLILFLLTIINDKDAIVLDFFSGSGTTAQAVMLKNSKDGGSRKFILTRIPEVTEKDSEAFRNGYNNICDIGKERIRRAGKKIKAEHPEGTDLDTGFRVFKCESSNYKDVAFAPKDYTQDMLAGLLDNIKEDRTDLDLLFDCMLRWGVELSLPLSSQKVDGCTIHNVNDGDLVACFDGNVTEKVIDAISALSPVRVVFRDNSFNEAANKMNLFELFKQKCNWTDEEVKKNVRVI
jgi:adenine-specific DNA-methyltransferase